MTWSWAAFMPHPPIIVPEVGKGREQDAGETLRGTREICEQISALNKENPPQVILVLSPHAPFIPGNLFVNTAEQARGSLARFGAPSVRMTLNTSKEALETFAAVVKTAGITATFGEQPDITQDHGTLVPLHFLAESFEGGKLPPVLIIGPSGISPHNAVKLGKALAALNGPRPWAMLASGDLSHRLKPGAPSGYNPDGAVFDQAVVDSLKEGKAQMLVDLSPAVCQNAGECGLRPALVLLSMCNEPLRVFSYEGPFGVGYCNALWSPGSGEKAREANQAADADKQRGNPAPAAKNTPTPKAQPPGQQGNIVIKMVPASGSAKAATQGGQRTFTGTFSVPTAARAPSQANKPRRPSAPPEQGQGHPYAKLARQTVAARLKGEALPDAAALDALSDDRSIWDVHQGCFVSIKNLDGSLRGCIGTFMPTQADLSAEIKANAVAAATRDPRFKPMREEELDRVRISVDVLSAPELVREGMELDPRKWGVIVTKQGRRGLLLPDLDGVDTVEQQLSIAARKGGISNLDGAEIYRFSVSRHYEGSS
ncbi:AmmeMemoRadiSam system protein A [Desulfovibrio sp. OttesenSCG-928-A18]|nr:AmmeMemoRadiSam system protein A [Desulfovibrio sp. OttesenSCG-928-A18]